MLFVGIDPGNNGAIAAVDEKERVQFVELLPTIKPDGKKSGKAQPDVLGVWRLFKPLFDLEEHEVFVTLEKMQALPGKRKGKKFVGGKAVETEIIHGSAANFGLGQWRGLLLAILYPHFRFEEVPQSRWQKYMHAGVPGNDTKARSRNAAQRLFVGVDLRKSDHPNARVPHDGKCEALLIALYALRKYRGQIQ